MAQRIVYGIGIGYTEAGTRVSDVEAKIKNAVRLISQAFGGCFITRGEGGWLDSEGRMVSEAGITITADSVNGVSAALIDSIADTLRHMFQQEAVHVVVYNAETWEKTADSSPPDSGDDDHEPPTPELPDCDDSASRKPPPKR